MARMKFKKIQRLLDFPCLKQKKRTYLETLLKKSDMPNHKPLSSKQKALIHEVLRMPSCQQD